MDKIWRGVQNYYIGKLPKIVYTITISDFANEALGLDDSDDSNAEDNWRNDYPDETESFDRYGYDDDGEELGKV